MRRSRRRNPTVDDRRLIETCDLALERELLQAASSGSMPAAARRRALSALGLLVLVTEPVPTLKPAPGRAKPKRRTRRLIKLGTLLAIGVAATSGSVLYLGRQAHVADEHVRRTRVAWQPPSFVGAEPQAEPALPSTTVAAAETAAPFELEPAAETEASSRSERPQTEPSTAR